MNDYKKKLLNELPEFRDYTLNFLNGNISKLEYKGFSGGYGVYAQRDLKSFMIRLRTSCGIMSRCQLHKIYQMAHKCNLDSIHLTTRQSVQFHNLCLDDVVYIMKEGIYNDIFSRGSGGNYPRNVGLSPLSGVDVDECFDVVDYAICTDKYFLSKITTYKLPRKLKVSYSSSYKDFAHCTIQDLGFVATKKDGKNFFEVFVGGGLGKNPKIGLKMPNLIEPNDVLYYVEALVQLYIDEGNYENKNKARVRYLVDKFGEDKFIDIYQKYIDKVSSDKTLKLDIKTKEINKKGSPIKIDDFRLIKQKQEGLYTVCIHPLGGIFKLKDLKNLLYELDKIKSPVIRLGMMEEMYILNLDAQEAKKLLDVTKNISGHSDLENSISCIGVPICQMGICNSQKLLSEIITHFKANDKSKKHLSVMPKLYISGCPNSCGVHQIGTIGFTGKLKKLNSVSVECFEMSVDGVFEVNKSKLGDVVGTIKASDIPCMLFEISTELIHKNVDFSSFIKNYPIEFAEIISKYDINNLN